MKISIVTVVLNGAELLPRTIESVQAQDWPEVEHIIVDGASADASVDVIRGYASRCPERVKWISEHDSGLYEAINKGIDMASGDVVGVLHAGDFYHRSDALRLVAQALGEDVRWRGVYADVRMVRPHDLNHVVRRYTSGHFRPWMFRMAMMPAHPSFFTYRSTFEDYGLYRTDMSIAADFEMLLRLLYVDRLPVRYLPVDLLTMLTGGVSDSGFSSKMEINRQDLRALRLHGVWSCMPLLWLRYPVKLWQYADAWLRP